MKTSFHTRIIFARLFFPVCLVFLIISSYFPVTAFAAQAADVQASPKTQAVLDYLTNLPNLSSNRVIAGQESYPGDPVITDIYKATGKYVGLWGIDYVEQNISTINPQLINFSNANGLITIVNHWDNPATGGDAWDITNVDFTQLITNGTTLNTTFKGYLDRVATGLQTLENNNVVVLYRPFHEMNGSWFWWSSKNRAQFIAVWQYVFNYMTTTKGLHNLLWVWSQDHSSAFDFSYYPGNAYVDIIGEDWYNSAAISTPANYSQLSSYGKPFAFTEWGPCSGAAECTSPQNVTPLISSIKSNTPSAVFFMAWAGNYSLDYNSGTSALLADPWVITRDEIPISGATSTPRPSAPTGLSIQ